MPPNVGTPNTSRVISYQKQLRTIIKILACILPALICCKSDRINDESYRITIESGKAIQNEDYERALEMLRHALYLDSNNYAAYNNRATITRNRDGDYEKVAIDLLKAVKLNPDYEVGRYNLIVNSMDLESYLNVVDLGEEYIRKFGDQRDVSFKIGEAHNMLGNYELALEKFDSILSDNAHDSRVFKEKSYALRHLNNMEAALENAWLAVKQEPEYASGWNNLAINYLEIDSFEHARKYFDLAIEFDSTSEIFYFNRGKLLIDNMNLRNQGCIDVLKSINLGSKNAIAYYKDRCE